MSSLATLGELEGVELADSLELSDSMRYTLERGHDDFGYWCGWWLDWQPHPGQLRWGRQRAKESYLITGRRWGKSEVEAAKALRFAFHHPDSVSLNCSITMDQAQIVFDKAVHLASRSRRFAPFLAGEPVFHPFPVLRFKNGAEIWARSTQRNCQFIRGHSFHRINYDEVAYGEKAHLDNVLLPCLLDHDGDFSGTSTPKGQNWVYFEVEQAKSAMREELARLLAGGLAPQEAEESLSAFFHRGPTSENLWLSPRAIARIAKRLPENARRQELEGEFLPTANTLFGAEDVVAIECPDLALPWDGQPVEVIPLAGAAEEGLRHGLTVRGGGNETEYQAGGRYVSGWDIGRAQSWTVGYTLRIDVTPWRIVGREAIYRQPWELITQAMARECKRWRSTILMDTTGVGDAVMAMPALRGLPIEGYKFSERSKKDLLIALQRSVQTRVFCAPFYRELHDQLLLYTWDEAEKDDEQTFDDVMALALVNWKALASTPGGLEVATAGSRALAKLEGRTSPRAGGSLGRF